MSSHLPFCSKAAAKSLAKEVFLHSPPLLCNVFYKQGGPVAGMAGDNGSTFY
jgi:hypothetical protein